MNKPTEKQYISLQQAFDYYNYHLFEDKLPHVLITFQRSKRAAGYYWSQVFESRQDNTSKVSEIALNIGIFKSRDDKTILSTLVHEMVHHWQFVFGTPSRTGYHNKEWAEKMKAIGLQPSTDGTVNGKETGQSCTHYVKYGEKFDTVTNILLRDKGVIDYNALDPKKPKSKNKNKTKYSCPECGTSAWAKDGIHLECGDCNVRLEVVD